MNHTMRISVWDDGHQAAEEGLITFDVSAAITRGVLEDGRLRFDLSGDVSFGWHVILTVTARGGETFDFHIELAENIDVTLPPKPIATLPPLVARGRFFATNTGERFTAIDATDFNLLARFYYEGGDAIVPVLEQRQAAGYNMARIWTDFSLEASGIGKLLMKEHPDAYDLIPDFCALLAKYGRYPHFTAYTGPGNHTPEPEHWKRLAAVVPPWALLSLVNEQNAHVGNRVDLGAFANVAGLLCSHGSNGADSNTVKPVWGWGEYHSNGLSEWWRKVGHNAMELSDRPMMATENTRHPDMTSSIFHAYDAAAGAALLCAGSCFHSVHGKNSQLWEGVELDCATAWAAGARSVDLAAQDGRYVHASSLEGPTVIRAYQRILPDGHTFTVKIRK